MQRIEIAPETIGHALREDKRLSVPPNQRSYSWEESHVRELYQDLADAMENGEPEYFLGSIVVVKSDHGKLEVNDGQQRLATTLMLLSAIRDHYFKAGEDERARLIRDRYLFSVDIDNLSPEPRLRLSSQDHEFFMNHVLLDPENPKRGSAIPTKPSHQRISTAYRVASRYVESLLKSVSSQTHHVVLNKWVQFLEKSARVIWVTVGDESTAYIIFETMNDRGLRLSAADLLKNYLYGKAQDRLPEVQDRWQSMVGSLETVETDAYVQTYIRHMWISLNGFTRSRDLFNRVKHNIKTKNKVVEFADQLESSSSHYAALLNPSHSLWDQYDPSTRKLIATLAELRVEQIRPLILSALKNFKKGEIGRFTFACVCWSVRFLLTGTPSGTLERYYSGSAHEVTKKKITTVDQLVKWMRSNVPGDDEFQARVSRIQVSNAKLARYYLRAMQLQEDGCDEAQYVPSDSGDITLEHIIPRSLTNSYLKKAKLDLDEAKTLSRRLGNLVLLQASQNRKVANDNFDSKKAILKASEFSLTARVAKCNSWGKKEIDARQGHLAKLAIRTWPLVPPK